MKLLHLLFPILTSSVVYAEAKIHVKSQLGQARTNLSATGDSHGISADLDYWLPFPAAVSLTFGEELTSLKPKDSTYKSLLRTQSWTAGLGLKTYHPLNSSIDLVISGHYIKGPARIDLNRSTTSSYTKGKYYTTATGFQLAGELSYHFKDQFEIVTGVRWLHSQLPTPLLVSYEEALADNTGLNLNTGVQSRQQLSLPENLAVDNFTIQLGIGVSL